jgi:hypothetical protein
VPDLFHADNQATIAGGVKHWIAEQPGNQKLQALASWFLELVAHFFALRGWRRASDPRQAFLWAGEFARQGAQEAETRAAFDWVLDHPPVDHLGRERFARDDVRRAVLARIRETRRAAAAAQTAPSAGPAASPEQLRAGRDVWQQYREAKSRKGS